MSSVCDVTKKDPQLSTNLRPYRRWQGEEPQTLNAEQSNLII